jgi:hypothetical protein
MVKCMRCRIMLHESRMHKIMRFRDITPGLNRNQIQAEFMFIIANNVGLGKRNEYSKINENLV